MATSVDSADSDSPFPRLSYRGSVLVFVSIGWFLFNSGRLLLPPLAVPIQETLAIGDAGFGFAITVLWGAYALLQFPGGISTDTIGSRTVLVGSLLVIGPAFAILALADIYWVFVFVLGLVGAGGSYFYIVSRTLPAKLYGDRKGRAIGIVTAAGNASGVLAPLAATAIIALSWRAVRGDRARPGGRGDRLSRTDSGELRVRTP